MNQLKLFNHWLARISAKYFPNDPSERSEFLEPTQQDKKSPTGTLSYNQWSTYLPIKLPKAWKVSRSFVGWTNSMEPTLDYGDMLLRVPVEEFKGDLVGQICIYEIGDMRIVHRCIDKRDDGLYIFKGDNNFRADFPVRKEQIKEVVIGILYTIDKKNKNQD